MTITESALGRRRIIGVLIGVVLALLTSAAIGIMILLRGSLPLLEGTTDLPGLSAPVAVERDAQGIAIIRGTTRQDVARATGFLHAQERFFQMDLTRRRAAGELAELFGVAALPLDRVNRIHRFRHRAGAVLAALPGPEQTLIKAYTEGVNRGLFALSTAPFEYLLLRKSPQPWRPEDTLLVIYAMYLDLQDRQWPRESARGLLYEQLPAALAEFLDPAGTEWDAPLQGEALHAPLPPGPEVFRATAAPAALSNLAWPLATADPPEATKGSNGWAVAGTLTSHGGALLANDMHLTLRVPNIWYRATLVYPDGQGQQRRLSGVTLPGTPALVAGSNGVLAWGYTNTYGDWADLVLLDTDERRQRYQTPEGPRPFEIVRETITVKGAPAETVEILETRWGPVLDRDHQGRWRALRWVAHDLQAVNLRLMELESASTVAAALEIAHRSGVPTQNLLLASANGQIAWTLIGPIPRRFGHDGGRPSSWADGQRGWSGWVEPEAYPRIVDPLSGRLWTANNRVVTGPWLEKMGDGGYALGARARQIRDALFARDRFDEADFLALQLDDRALFLERWRTLLLATLKPESVAAHPPLEALRSLVIHWGGRAAVDSVGYRAVRTFRLAVRERAFAPLIAACRRADPQFDYFAFQQHEGPLWQLVSQQPAHLLDPRYADWSALLEAAAVATWAELTADGQPLATQTWGDAQTIQLRHPLSRSLPWLSHWLDMPAQALPGDVHMPRIQTQTHGASERLAIAPGREAAAILHLPGGQSGHPLSPYYRAGHEAWAAGRPTPLDLGPIRHRLILEPTPL